MKDEHNHIAILSGNFNTVKNRNIRKNNFRKLMKKRISNNLSSYVI